MINQSSVKTLEELSKFTNWGHNDSDRFPQKPGIYQFLSDAEKQRSREYESFAYHINDIGCRGNFKQKTDIAFFGCSFTQNTNSKFRATRPISMQEYAGHTHITKVQSNFLEFDLAYNDNIDYYITNFGNGSYGNFTIGSIIDKRIESLEGTDNIAIVQLSAIIRNEDSLKSVLKMNPTFDKDTIKYDYITDDIHNIDEFYHLCHLKRLVCLMVLFQS
jgi:hypothetical protein